METSLANTVVDALAGVARRRRRRWRRRRLVSTTPPPTRPPSETAQAAAARPRRVRRRPDTSSVDRVVVNRGSPARTAADAGAATLSAPLVWGGERARIRQARSAPRGARLRGGHGGGGGTIAGTRAREAAAWGLASAAGAVRGARGGLGSVDRVVAVVAARGARKSPIRRRPRRRRRRRRRAPAIPAVPSARSPPRCSPGRHGRRGDARSRFFARWTDFRGIGLGRCVG